MPFLPPRVNTAAPSEETQAELCLLRAQVAELQEQLRRKEFGATEAEYLAAIVEGSDDIIISKTLDGIITSWNRAAERTFGYTAEEMIGQPISRLIPPDRPNDLASILGHIRRGERVEHYETVRRHKDGRLLQVSLTVSPIYNRAGQIVGASKIARDITERKRIEAAFRQNEERFRATFEQAAVGMAQVGLDGGWLRVNQRLCDIVGYGREELLKLTFADITHPDDLGADWAHARALLRGEINTYSMEKRYVRKDGSLVWIDLTASLLRDEAGKPQSFISVVVDIEAQKRTEGKLREVNETLEQRVEERTRELAEANRELEAFAYSVSHDLRAPLRSIDGFGQRLLDRYRGRVLDNTAVDYLERMTRASQRMGQIIEDLLNLSRLGRAGMTYQCTDLSALAESVFAEERSRDGQRQATVQVEEGLTACGDPHLLRVALENLLGNAWKYTGKKEEALIKFGAMTQGGERVYYVQDNGAGFNMAHAQHLFAPFQRLHRAGEFEGNGIGLAIVQRIVHRHGGRVWAEAEQDKGATFFFTLPAEERKEK